MLQHLHYFNSLRYLKPGNLKSKLEYVKWRNYIDKTEFLTKAELNELQWDKLKNLLAHSYNHVPYYRSLFESIDAHPSDIKTFSDFEQIPFLTKSMLRESPEKFVSDQIKKKSFRMITTGGSTGKPLGFYRQPVMDTIERAFMYHQWSRVGFNEKGSRIILRGEPLSKNRLYQKRPYSNVWLLSSYHLSEDHISEYVEILNKIQPDFFHVYPSSLFLFTQLLVSCPLKLNFKPKAVLCGSEPVFDFQRKLFEEVYDTRVYSWLGQAEGAVLAGECEHSNHYHVWPQHSYVELIDENGIPIHQKGRSGEIVGTTINNFGAPFIRYKTGDIGTYHNDHCPHCGRNYMILNKIDGREQDKILLEDGRVVPLTAITFGLHFNAYRKVNKMQIMQKIPGVIHIYIHTLHSVEFTSDDEDEIRTKMMNAVGGKLKINFVYTDDLKRTKSGKHIYFIQELQ